MTQVSGEIAQTALPFRVVVTPQSVEGGLEVELTLLETDESARDYLGDEIRFVDEDGGEVGLTELIEVDGKVQSQPMVADAPTLPGEHRWAAWLVEGEGEPSKAELPVLFSFLVDPHRISLSAWGAPGAIEAGGRFEVTLGIKCPCGCSTAGWPYLVLDGSGRQVASGAVGNLPWPGTEGLHHATIQLRAPGQTGPQTWTILATDPQRPVAHAERSQVLVVHTTPVAEHSLRVTAVDAVSGDPVAGAKVVAHPHRGVTGRDGTAVLRVPAGKYTLFVSGKQYFPYKLEGEVTADVEIRAALHVDREFSEADAWA